MRRLGWLSWGCLAFLGGGGQGWRKLEPEECRDVRISTETAEVAGG